MMDKYNHFAVEDLVWDAYFRQWVLSPTRESEAAWTDWSQQNAAFNEKAGQAREIVLSLKVRENQLADAEISALVAKTVSKLNQPLSQRIKSIDKPRMPLLKTAWFRIAASVSILLVAGLLSKTYLHNGKQQDTSIVTEAFHEPKTSFIKKINETKEPMLVELADDSKVVLTPGSYIQYDKNFLGDTREVFLVGEAFFDVAKNPDRPFFVYANELVTKVLGTSFTIKAFESSREVTVEVKSGRVSVFAKSDPDAAEKAGNNRLEGLVLSPNQKMIFKRDEVRMVKTLVEKPEIILPKDQIPQFSFEDTPVSEVFGAIEAAYGVDIVYDAELLKDCPLTATLDEQPLNEKLMIICKAVEATYEVLDGQIVIHSEGCRN
ncbi:FecR family protein [Dyadobacter sp. CY323]|uniref:FecR family protein n=1 Tax=Dyadobacter sp. CY323 TaxID=2907302 RepID=UPI001F1622E4|nr:FecR family protein [Dyadobacter sp. CY323]MCE6988105.1 FecR family protein [Dyadobacter sp. CY323]